MLNRVANAIAFFRAALVVARARRVSDARRFISAA
jgi:hypothetical protein